MYEFCTAEPKKIAPILRFLPFRPVGAPPGLSFNGFRPASYPVSSVLERCRGKGERPSGSMVSGPACRLRLFRERPSGHTIPVAAVSVAAVSVAAVRVAAVRVAASVGALHGGAPVAACRSQGSGSAAVRLRRRSGLSIEALWSRRVGPGYPVPAFGCGIGRGSPSRRSGCGVSVAGFRGRGVPATPSRSGAAP